MGNYKMNNKNKKYDDRF